MSRRIRTTTLALGGAVALASGAYALGSESGDGRAVAGDGGSRDVAVHRAPAAFAARGGPPVVACERGLAFGSDRLADELGVDADELEDALRDFRGRRRGHPRDDFARGLADQLGIDASKVEDALADLRPRPHAKRLDRLPPARPKRLDRLPPARPKLRVHFGPPVAELAKELGVSRSELRKALSALKGDARDRIEAEHERLVRLLVDRFGLSEDRVRDALPKLPPPPPGP